MSRSWRSSSRRDQFAVLMTESLYHQDVGLLWEDAEYLQLRGLSFNAICVLFLFSRAYGCKGSGNGVTRMGSSCWSRAITPVSRGRR